MPSLWYFVNKVRRFQNDFFFFFLTSFSGAVYVASVKPKELRQPTSLSISWRILVPSQSWEIMSLIQKIECPRKKVHLSIAHYLLHPLRTRRPWFFAKCSMKPSNFSSMSEKGNGSELSEYRERGVFRLRVLTGCCICRCQCLYTSWTSMTFDTLSHTIASQPCFIGQFWNYAWSL